MRGKSTIKFAPVCVSLLPPPPPPPPPLSAPHPLPHPISLPLDGHHHIPLPSPSPSPSPSPLAVLSPTYYSPQLRDLWLLAFTSLIAFQLLTHSEASPPLPPAVAAPSHPHASSSSSAASPSPKTLKLSSRIVTTKYGALRGFLVDLPNPNLQSVEVFMGLPYASPPVRSLRFMPPVTPAHWSGVKSALHPGPVCPQKLPNVTDETETSGSVTLSRMNVLKKMMPKLQNQSEDCLYLNIYAPAVVSRQAVRVPVLMYIQGESYEWDAGSSYDGSVLASFAKMVVVTINFRLGVLGFFPALDGSSRGNFGIMDQVAALHWIQENIGEFGGDPSNVTVFGQGHGAAFVNLLMLTPMARGLFHRAIMGSGSAVSPWALATDAVNYSKILATSLNCPNDSGRNSVMVDCLRQKSVQELLSVNFKVPTHLISFGPTVDGIVIPNDPGFLMGDASSLFGHYDLLYGVVRAEAYNEFKNVDQRHGIDSSRRDRIIRTLVRNLFTYHLQEIFLTIVNEYTDWTKPTAHPINIWEGVAEAVGDALIVAPTIRTGLFHSKVGKKTFFYNFGYATEGGNYPARVGCVHGEDLPYILGAPLVPGYQLGFFSTNYSKQEASLSEAVMTYWSNFAKYGDPNANTNQENDPSNLSKTRAEKLIWPQYEEQQQHYMHITSKPKAKVEDHYHAHRLSYWLNLLPKLHVAGPSSSSSSLEHHLLEEHDNPMTYEGNIRETSRSEHQLVGTQPGEKGSSNAWGSSASSSLTKGKESKHTTPPSKGGNAASWPVDSSHLNSAFDGETDINSYLNGSFSMIVQEGAYSTALSVTIAVGCSLLILNILVFAGVFYQRDRGFRESNANKSYEMQNKSDATRITKYQSLHSPAKVSDRSPSIKANSICSEGCVPGMSVKQSSQSSTIQLNAQLNQHYSASSSCHPLLEPAIRSSSSCNCPIVSCTYACACNCQMSLPMASTGCKGQEITTAAEILCDCNQGHHPMSTANV